MFQIGGRHTNLALQMDGGDRQDPYSVWLGDVTLPAW